MHIDSTELRQVAAVEAPRLDMYTGIHKALRAYMADTLLAVGRMDGDDQLEVAQVTQRVLDLLGFCRNHLQHENDFVHAAIEARTPGASARIAGEHAEHERHLAQLADAVSMVRDASPAARPRAAQFLYRELALFIADNFEHMHVEETAHNAVLWARYSDEELAAIHDALVGSIPPADMLAVARWLVPFMNPAERLAVLADIRGKAPAAAFKAILGTVEPHLTELEWAKLMRGLGLPVVPGLVA